MNIPQLDLLIRPAHLRPGFGQGLRRGQVYILFRWWRASCLSRFY